MFIRFWPVVHLEELSNKNIKELLHAELASLGKSVRQEDELRILTHCRTPATSYPLYVILIATDIARYVSFAFTYILLQRCTIIQLQ